MLQSCDHVLKGFNDSSDFYQHNGACIVLVTVNMPERGKKSNKYKDFVTKIALLSADCVLFVKKV